MSKAPIIKTFTVLIAMMFLFVQGVSQAHATEHGEHDHSHDGVECEITLLAVEQIITEPPVPIPSRTKTTSKSNWSVPFYKSLTRTFDGRAPPPRGPPTL